ncbi:McrA Restriction endonuclease [uncultured Caudovirales phage]|uniref:McrA Restriction endonuclease n=1 Tax=uncultured Caudovirales phage TaxID=2100421 RepID=A0A6J5KWE0_9CAUD|nr:McrA Restriction endonuclease [uncultured Caudovirales phage]CAB5208508.1 McrA Restriction endonuclease [uncultured Caudovirales phage]
MSDTLVLNADGLPVSVMPLSVIPWEEAIRYMVLDKADVLMFHENWTVRSARWETQVPSVIMLRDFMKSKSTVRFSRANVYLRDNGTCQYCSKHIERKVATLDHVVPVSKGGKTTWENSTTACGPCNSAKADKLGMKPKVKPYKPDFYELVNKRKKQGFENIRFKEWLQFIQ